MVFYQAAPSARIVRTLRTALIATLTLTAASAHAAVVWDESVNGSLSATPATPTPIPLTAGTNSVLGTVGGTAMQDYLAVTVPAGDLLSSYTLAAYTSTDAQGFTGFQTGSSFVGSNFSASSYAGYAHFGTGATNPAVPTNVIGTDLLPLMANPAVAAGATGFTDPLPAGTYTFLIQQLGATTTYQFDFGVTPATPTPEPASVSLLTAGTLLLFHRRRINKR